MRWRFVVGDLEEGRSARKDDRGWERRSGDYWRGIANTGWWSARDSTWSRSPLLRPSPSRFPRTNSRGDAAIHPSFSSCLCFPPARACAAIDSACFPQEHRTTLFPAQCREEIVLLDYPVGDRIRRKPNRGSNFTFYISRFSFVVYFYFLFFLYNIV